MTPPGSRSCIFATMAQTPPLPVNFAAFDVDEAKAAFEAAHKGQFGFIYDNRALVVETIGVEGSGGAVRGVGRSTLRDAAKPMHTRSRPNMAHNFHRRPLNALSLQFPHPRTDLRPGASISGPALIIEANQTIVIEPGWQADPHRPRPHRPQAHRGQADAPVRCRHQGRSGSARSL